MFVTVPASRAMRCQMNAQNNILLQAEYDNLEFSRFSIQKMQQEIEAFNAHAITAATAVRFSKARTISAGTTSAELIASGKG